MVSLSSLPAVSGKMSVRREKKENALTFENENAVYDPDIVKDPWSWIKLEKYPGTISWNIGYPGTVVGENVEYRQATRVVVSENIVHTLVDINRLDPHISGGRRWKCIEVGILC